MATDKPKRLVPRKQIKFTEPSKTKQHFKKECDINYIVNQFDKTGMLPVRDGAFYADLPVIDYHGAMNAVLQAQDAFDSLPAKVRDRFHNDPGEMLEFLKDENNNEEAIKLGLSPAPIVDEPPSPTPVIVVETPPVAE